MVWRNAILAVLGKAIFQAFRWMAISAARRQFGRQKNLTSEEARFQSALQ
jgi:hypothetical protein